MHEVADSQAEQRALLSHTALCFVVAAALGFFGGAFAGLTHFQPPTIARYALVSVCIATCLAIFWCTPDGPVRWRPFVISSKVAERIFGASAGIIVCGGSAMLLAEWL